MKIRIHSVNNELLYTNLSPEENSVADNCSEQNATFVANGRKFRHGKLALPNGVVYLLSDDDEMVARQRYFKEILQAHSILLQTYPAIRTRVSQGLIIETKRLLHNITELNAHNVQEMFSLISQDELRGNPKPRDLIKNKIRDKADQAAATFLRVIKNNVAIGNEFSIFQKIQDAKPKIDRQKHSIRRALENVLHVFYPDFNDQRIIINIQSTDVDIMFDYEAFRVAVHHLLDNAAKYAMPDSNIEISFRKEKDFFVSQFNMMSMEILPDEITKINSEGYSGHFPKKAKKNGQGIGMGIINKMLPLNGAKPVVLPNVDKSKEISLNGIQFRNNIFEIHFQNKWLA